MQGMSKRSMYQKLRGGQRGSGGKSLRVRSSSRDEVGVGVGVFMDCVLFVGLVELVESCGDGVISEEEGVRQSRQLWQTQTSASETVANPRNTPIAMVTARVLFRLIVHLSLTVGHLDHISRGP
jgi:hypothetical protein